MPPLPPLAAAPDLRPLTLHTMVCSAQGVMRGMLSRISGEDGFQLVNVTNAPIQLQAFQLKESESWLVNRVSVSPDTACSRPQMASLGSECSIKPSSCRLVRESTQASAAGATVLTSQQVYQRAEGQTSNMFALLMLVPIAATCQVAFWHLFVRHYTSTGLTEARKILGGAGPAVATLLASAIWASISLVDLGQEVVRRRKPPSALVTGFFFYTLTSFGQVSSGGSLLAKQQLSKASAELGGTSTA